GTGRLQGAGGKGGEGPRPDAPRGLRRRGLPVRRLPAALRPARRHRDQRLLRLGPGPRRPDRRPHAALRPPRPGARLLPEQGDRRLRVRRRGQSRRPGRGEGHVRLPAGLRELPPRHLRAEAVAVGRDLLRAAGVPGPPELGRQQPAADPPDPREGPRDLRRGAPARVLRRAADLPRPRANRAGPGELGGEPRRPSPPRYHQPSPMATQPEKLSLSPREPGSSRATRRLRREGRVPGVIYGGGADPVAFDVDERLLRHALAASGAVLEPA